MVENLSTLGARLKEERERVGMTQVALASLTGASKSSQIGWESGRAVPNAEYLATALTLGMDVVYVLTGMRSDAAVMDAFRRAAEATKMASVTEAERMALWVSLVNGMQQHGDQERQRRLVAAWSRCSDADQDVVLRMAEGLAATPKT